MKKAFHIIVFLGFYSFATAQRHPEFGFVVKTGTFAFPKEKKELPIGSTSSDGSSKLITKLGSTYSLGVYQSIPLGAHFRISGEILYSSSIFGVENRSNSFLNFNGAKNYTRIAEKQEFNESSLILPIKLHYRFKKEGKTSIFMGAGVYRKFSAIITQANTFKASLEPEIASYSNWRFSKWSDFTPSFGFNAGFNYQFSPNTSFGIEYDYEKFEFQDFEGYPHRSSLEFINNCFCLISIPNNRPNMNSFSFSLRHNILD